MTDLEALFDELFPITRSITGRGYRESLDIFARHMDLTVHQYPTGKQVFDWVVPKEWNISSACLQELNGKVICDLKESNLHVLNYSTPVDAVISRAELDEHLYSLPNQPHLVPYVTSYYKEAWGFCVTEATRKTLRDTQYRVVIDSELTDGSVDVAEANIAGSGNATFLITSYLCHPSMANNELSGPLVLLRLYEKLKATLNLRLSYKFVLNPETIGTVCYLHSHGETLKQYLVGGLVLTCLGGPQKKLSYKLSRRGNSRFDKMMRYFEKTGTVEMRDFTPAGGSDERQYCSPGFNLPVGQMARTVYGEYAEYHTSGDDKAFLEIDRLEQTADDIYRLLLLHDALLPLARHEPHCELQLGRRNLYPNTNFQLNKDKSSDSLEDSRNRLNAISWILNFADGECDLIDIAERSKLDLKLLQDALDILLRQDLVYYAPR
jgi:aminopeptidase-like protein